MRCCSAWGKPVAGVGSAALVICRLVPFVFRGNEVSGPGVAGYRHQGGIRRCAVERVRPGFRRARSFGPGRLAVLQPVAEAGGVAPGDIEVTGQFAH